MKGAGLCALILKGHAGCHGGIRKAGPRHTCRSGEARPESPPLQSALRRLKVVSTTLWPHARSCGAAFLAVPCRHAKFYKFCRCHEAHSMIMTDVGRWLCTRACRA